MRTCEFCNQPTNSTMYHKSHVICPDCQGRLKENPQMKPLAPPPAPEHIKQNKIAAKRNKPKKRMRGILIFFSVLALLSISGLDFYFSRTVRGEQIPGLGTMLHEYVYSIEAGYGSILIERFTGVTPRDTHFSLFTGAPEPIASPKIIAENNARVGSEEDGWKIDEQVYREVLKEERRGQMRLPLLVIWFKADYWGIWFHIIGIALYGGLIAGAIHWIKKRKHLPAEKT